MRLLRCLYVALILIALAASPARAHALLARTEPPDLCLNAFVSESVCSSGQLLAAPPQTVRLWFTEPVQPFAGGVTVTGPSGRMVHRDGVNIEGTQLNVAIDASEPGSYLVNWRVITADTHPARGQFAFSVGHASAAASATSEASIGAVSAVGLLLQVTARWLHFAGFALAFGVLAFRELVFDDVGRPSTPSGRGGSAALHPQRGRLRGMYSGERPYTLGQPQHLGRLIGVGLVCLLSAEPLALLGQTASLSAADMLDPAIVSGALDSSFGRALALRLGAAMGLWVLLGIESDGARIALPAALLVGALLALVDGASAHAASLQPEWLGYAVNALHLSAMGLWLGGIVSLMTLWRLPEIASARPALVAHFTPLAAASLAGIAFSGILMAWSHQALPYIGVLGLYSLAALAKFVLLLAVAGLAAFGFRHIGTQPERWWLAEAAVLAVALVLAGLLVSLPPPA
jgi:copper transport protein